MKTNIGLETSDEDRRLIAAYLDRNSDTKRLATRNDIKDLVTQLISDIITQAHEGEYDGDGRGDENPDGAGGHRRDSSDDGPAGDQGLPDHADPGVPFVPSRGDEPYLFKARDPALREIHSRFLDVAEELDQYVWQQMERNRE